MKTVRTNFLVICILNMIAYQSFCQEAPFLPQAIEVNLLDLSNMPKYKIVLHGQSYIMKIENINRSLFKVESTVSQQDHNTAIPEIFKSIKLPGYLNLALPTDPQEVVPKNVGHAPGITPGDYKDLIKNNLATIKNSNRRIGATVVLNNEMKNLFSSCDKSFESIKKELDSTVNSFLGISSSDSKVLSAALKSFLETNIQNAVSSNEALDTLVPIHLYSINVKMKENADNIISKLEKENLNEKDTKNARKLFALKAAKDENELLKNYKDSLKVVVAKASGLVTELKQFRDENKIQDLVNNFNMINYSNFTYTSEPIKVMSDEVKFDIKITSDKLIPCNIPTKISISETYKTKGGLKVDFSTGIFFNGGNQDFLGRELLYKPVNDSNVKIESKDGGKRLLISVGALMHIYKRSGNNVNWAISPGLSTSTVFDGINFHLGGSAIFGGENRIVITGGMVLRESKILDKNYNYSTQYLKNDMPDSPPTIKVFPKVGWFFSLTYNFSKFKTQ